MKATFFICIGLSLLVLLLVTQATEGTQGTEDRKQLAGPPEEFEAMRLPQPSKKNAVSESSALLVESLTCGQQQTVSLPVDSETLFRLTVMSPLYDQLQLQLVDAQGQPQLLDPQHAVLEPWALGDSVGLDLSLYVPLRTWSFTSPTPGLWTLSVAWKDAGASSSCAAAKLGLLLYNENPLVKLNVALSSFDMETWEECGVTAILDQPFSEMETHVLAQWPSGHITSGQVEFTLPDHSQRLLTMHDDGQGLDRRVADGIWSGSLLAKQSGTYNARSVVYGLSPLGHPFVRSVQLPFVVLDDHRELTGVATVAPLSDTRVRFLLAVDGPSSTKYRAYAQVFGTSLSSHEIVPIAWIAALVNTQNITNMDDGRTEYFVPLELDLNWLLRAQATGPFELREVSLQCANMGVIISSQPTVTVVASRHSSTVAQIISAHLTRHNSSAPLMVITPEMREGVRPGYLRAHQEGQAVPGPLPLVLSHGYCSDENPFYRDKAIFGEQAYYFLDAVANRGVDQFASMIKEFAVANGVVEGQPFATIGHSQGGMALTHLLNYYWTGMDAGRGFRPVQSLGTPYQGCTVAGNTAAFGSLFGYGCGANFDLTPAGAALWLTGITSTTRARVSYYTTTYQQGNVLGDYCSLAANSILKFPNDGVTEQYYAALPGGDSQGETQRQCHTSGMKYIPQYHDSTRNAQMNQCARYGC